ncbi:MAG: hypothetical protein WD073_06525 [Xanthobacteraceae bacterium]
MKHKIAIAVAIAAVSLAVLPAAPAVAQGALASFEAVTIVRSMGLDPVGRPVRRGSTYVLRALDGYGQEVSVTVDARYGRVLSVQPAVPVAAPYVSRPPTYVPGPAYPPEPYYPEEFEPGSLYEPLPPDGPNVIYAPREYSGVPRPPAPVPGVRYPAVKPKPPSATASTPLPKPAPRAVAVAPAEPKSPEPPELTTGSIGEPAAKPEVSSAPAIPPIQGLE